MPVSELDIDLIDRFLDDSLKDSDRSGFDKRRLEIDFEEYLQEQILIRDVLAEKGRVQQKAHLQDLEAKFSSEAGIIPFHYKYRNWILAIAAAILIGVAGVSRWNIPQSAELFATYYTAYPNLIDPLTKGSLEELSAYQLYEQGEYDKAIKNLTVLDLTEEQSWYLTLSFIGSQDYTKAGGLLDEIISERNHEYYEPAQWYRALLYLRENEISNCQDLLRKIQKQSDHPYNAKARRLLEEL